MEPSPHENGNWQTRCLPAGGVTHAGPAMGDRTSALGQRLPVLPRVHTGHGNRVFASNRRLEALPNASPPSSTLLPADLPVQPRQPSQYGTAQRRPLCPSPVAITPRMPWHHDSNAHADTLWLLCSEQRQAGGGAGPRTSLPWPTWLPRCLADSGGHTIRPAPWPISQDTRTATPAPRPNPDLARARRAPHRSGTPPTPSPSAPAVVGGPRAKRAHDRRDAAERNKGPPSGPPVPGA